jgi:hypothetical protein
MAEPVFLGDGTTERRTDSRWVRWVKILGAYQNSPGALAANNPLRGDPIRVIKQKVLNAVNGTSYTG